MRAEKEAAKEERRQERAKARTKREVVKAAIRRNIRLYGKVKAIRIHLIIKSKMRGEWVFTDADKERAKKWRRRVAFEEFGFV